MQSIKYIVVGESFRYFTAIFFTAGLLFNYLCETKPNILSLNSLRQQAVYGKVSLVRLPYFSVFSGSCTLIGVKITNAKETIIHFFIQYNKRYKISFFMIRGNP